MAEQPREKVTQEEKQAAARMNRERAQMIHLGIAFERDEAIDGCTVYEPDGWCPHGYRGLAQIRCELEYGV